MNNSCAYGCGNEGIFKLKNGKYCCSTHSNKCTVNRRKNSLGVAKAYTDGKKISEFTHSKARDKSVEVRKQKRLEQLSNTKAFSIHSSNKVIKTSLLNDLNWENKCAVCNLSTWNNQPLTLELDHVDGNWSNSSIENLRLLCPNCHSQTSTYCGKSINSGKKKVDDETLIAALKKHSNIRQALIECNLSPRGGNYIRAYKLIEQTKEKQI